LADFHPLHPTCGENRYYVWVAVDVERMEVIATKISKDKGNLEWK
jgi:hypothetical protein